MAKEARGDAVAGEGREGAIIQRGIHLLVSSVLRLLARPPGEWASHMSILSSTILDIACSNWMSIEKWHKKGYDTNKSLILPSD